MNKILRAVGYFVFFYGVASTSSCLDVASGRATRDLTIGHANAAGIAVDVDEGLAAVRDLNETELHLWASAPSLSLQINPGSTNKTGFQIRIENVLADAELQITSTTTAPTPVAVIESPHATEKIWHIDLQAGQTVQLSLTAPDHASQEPWRFAVYADVQEALDQVQDIYAKMNDTPNIRFALISGDLTSQGRIEQLEQFQSSMKTLQFPCFATLGNHELGTRDDLYHDYFGRGNYSFRFRSVRFSMLDSASATIDPLAYSWLDGWLAESVDELHVVTMHIPPLDPVGSRNGSFASHGEADQLLTKLARHGVDMTFYGHVHSFYAFENAGIPAFISGGGGAIPERLDGIGRHFLTVDVVPPNKIEQVAIVRVD